MRKQKRFAVIQPHPTFCGAKCAGKSAKKVLRNNSGFSYIFICVITLFAAMLIVAGLSYTDAMNIIRVQKEEVKQSLDSAVTEEAVAYYDALKQGNRYSDYVEASFLSDRAYRALGFGLPQTEIRTVYRDGMAVSVMERPEITVSMDGGFGVQVRYRLTVPFCVFGQHITDISVPVETGSFYQLK